MALNGPEVKKINSLYDQIDKLSKELDSLRGQVDTQNKHDEILAALADVTVAVNELACKCGKAQCGVDE